MKRTFSLIFLILTALIVAGCSTFATNGTDIDPPNYAESSEDISLPSIPAQANLVPTGESFKDPFAKGDLKYTVTEGSICQSLDEFGALKNDFVFPFNSYPLDETGQQLRNLYQEIEDYLADDGSVVDTHRLVALDITVQNENALGQVKKTEFNINNINLMGGEPSTIYYLAYFSESGNVTDSVQPFHYILTQGEEIQAKLGFFVLEDDIKNGRLVGVVGLNTDKQILFDVGF